MARIIKKSRMSKTEIEQRKNRIRVEVPYMIHNIRELESDPTNKKALTLAKRLRKEVFDMMSDLKA